MEVGIFLLKKKKRNPSPLDCHQQLRPKTELHRILSSLNAEFHQIESQIVRFEQQGIRRPQDRTR